MNCGLTLSYLKSVELWLVVVKMPRCLAPFPKKKFPKNQNPKIRMHFQAFDVPRLYL